MTTTLKDIIAELRNALADLEARDHELDEPGRNLVRQTRAILEAYDADQRRLT